MTSHHARTIRETTASARRLSVLLVDDQPFVGAAMTRLLASERDIELHCCHEPIEALRQANRLRPDLILQDLVMPEIDGLTLVRMFRHNPPTASTPIVVLSGDNDASARERAADAGANGFLVKLPVRSVLVARIRDLAAGRPTSCDLTQPVIAANEPVLDPTVLDALKDSPDAALPEFALDLIDQFSDEADRRVKVLQSAAERRDTNTLKAAAHSLKGCSFTVGANRLGVLCSRLEQHLALHPDGAGASGFIAALPNELAHVRQAFADFRQGTR